MQGYSSDDLIKIEELQPAVVFGKFWPRFWALLLDGLILLPLTLLLFYNQTAWKSIGLLICIKLIETGYKSFFENKYGATPGKKILKLKVVDTEFGKASLNKILLRNIFQISSGVVTLAFSLYIFSEPFFYQVSTLKEYSLAGTNIPGKTIVDFLFLAIYLADLIYFLRDDDCRSLHDMIAKTYVIQAD